MDFQSNHDQKEPIAINRLMPADAIGLYEMFNAASPDYSRYFTPFDLSLPTIQTVLEKAKQDHFYGIRAGTALVGFFMLRGFDEGYKIPGFGVWISESCQGLGLSTLAIHFCCAVCRLNGVSELMLKVYPDNIKARHLYEKLGFTFKDIDVRNGNLVYFKEL